MLWPRLKSMKCPKCGGKISFVGEEYKCETGDFKISQTRFDEVVQSLYSGQRVKWMEDVDQNLLDLNNL